MTKETTSNVWVKKRFTSPHITENRFRGLIGVPYIHGWTDGGRANGLIVPFLDYGMASFALEKADTVWKFAPESDTFTYDTSGDPDNPPNIVRGNDITYVAFDGEPIRKHVYPIFGAAFQWEEQPLGDDPEEND